MNGIGMSDVGGDVLDYIRSTSAVSGAHYPERCAHIFIINVPIWFSAVSIIAPLFDSNHSFHTT